MSGCMIAGRDPICWIETTADSVKDLRNHAGTRRQKTRRKAGPPQITPTPLVSRICAIARPDPILQIQLWLGNV